MVLIDDWEPRNTWERCDLIMSEWEEHDSALQNKSVHYEQQYSSNDLAQ